MKKVLFCFFCIVLFLAVVLFGKDFRGSVPIELPLEEVVETLYQFNNLYSRWVDSVFNSLSPDRRISQLFFADAYSSLEKNNIDAITELIKNYCIGGLIFFEGGPRRQALLANRYQALSKTPLLIAMDGDWGLRLDSCVSFPEQMALDAIEDLTLTRQMGAEIGQQYQRLGVNISLLSASNANNKSERVLAYMRGLQEQRILTDELNMKIMTGSLEVGEAEIMAIEEGADILLTSANIPGAIEAVIRAVDSGRIDRQQVEMSCRRILAAKEWARLNRYKPISTNGLYARLNSPQTDLLNRKLVEASLTVVQNRNDILPLKRLDKEKTAILLTDVSQANVFLNTLNLYEENDYYFLTRNVTTQQDSALFDNLKRYSRVIVGIHNTNSNPAANYGILPNFCDFVDMLADSTNVILCLFTSPHALSSFTNKTNMAAIVAGYQETPLVQDYMAQLLYGAIAGKGALPVSIDSRYRYGTKVYTEGGLRLKYSIPEEVQVFSQKLQTIDAMVRNAINEQAFPGCQILAARNGVVFFKKEYGNTRYDDLAEPVQPHHIYDLASVSKIAGALPPVMFFNDNGTFTMNGKLADYFPELRNSNKANITMIDLLTHQSQLPAHIAFYLRTKEPLDKETKLLEAIQSPLHSIYLGPKTYLNSQRRFKDGYFAAEESDSHNIQVADSMFIVSTYCDSIMRGIRNARLLARQQYVYSDLGFILLGKIVEKLSEETLDEFATQHFFAPLGATTLRYTPLKYFPQKRIVPTSNDTVFRKQWLQGYVNDENAALMGGVGGHAGLFSNANDLAKLMQMYMNMGTYGGERYIKEETITEFTSSPFAKKGNRRGLGFDKPTLSPRPNDLMAKNTSKNSFGHTGFTGTMVWMDPDNGLMFIFLSNRVCPDVTNNKLSSLALRAKIYDVLVKAIDF